MKVSLIVFYALFAFSGISQMERIPSNRTYSNLSSELTYPFLLNSKTEQSLNWDTIYFKGEQFFAQVLNNTNDTVFLDQACCISHPPIMWRINDRKNSYLPNDTINIVINMLNSYHLYTKLNNHIHLKYYTALKDPKKKLKILTKGFLIDSAIIERHIIKQREKELIAIKNNPNNRFYDSGELKSSRNPKPRHDSIPYFRVYYKNGMIKQENFYGEGTTLKLYNASGLIKRTADREGLKTVYYPNGNLKFERGNDPYSATKPFKTSYFENGCLKKEIFFKETIIKRYDSTNCNKLINTKIIDKTETKTKHGKIITYYETGKITGKNYQIHGSVNKTSGQYIKDKLINGKLSYYALNGTLLFESKIRNGNRDSVLSKGEKQRQQINLINENGQKTGLWITDKTTKQPLKMTTDPTIIYQSTVGFNFFQYEYKNGDTIARLTLQDLGGIESYLYVRDKEKRIKAGQFYARSYYENGFLSHQSYQLKNGLLIGIKYSKTNKNERISGKKGSNGQLIFKNNKLVEIQSKPLLPPPIEWENHTRFRHSTEYCIEKGYFKNFELYNGFIYYYKADSTRRLTEKVLNGIIQSNPKVNLKQPQLQYVALKHDLNFNGWIEQRELNSIQKVNISIPIHQLDAFRWHELNYFKNLNKMQINNLIYQLDDYNNYPDLKTAILAQRGQSPSDHRWPWDPPFSPDQEIENLEFHPVDETPIDPNRINDSPEPRSNMSNQ